MARIVYVGNFRHSWCTEVHVARDARTLGHEVVEVQEPSEPSMLRGFSSFLEQTASGADLLLYQRTWGLPRETTELWRRIEQYGCKTASYHLDLYVGLQREDTIRDDPFWTTGTVFSADGDKHTQDRLLELGVLDHHWLPAAIVSDEANIMASGQTPVRVAFVGSACSTYHPEWPWRCELMGGLAQRYGRQFKRYPVDNRRLHGLALSQLYASVPVIVGDSLALPGHRYYWSDRFYETVGRGGYLIGPNVPGIEEHFVSGEHLDLYDLGDLDHVFELVDQALADPDGTRAIARAGCNHVRHHHTYAHRVAEMLDVLGIK